MSVWAILAVFAVLLVLEERHRPAASSAVAWSRLGVNWGLGLINIGLIALVPVAALTAAAFSHGGPLAELGALAAFGPLLLARSFAAYWLHRLFHAVPWLWRIHRVHHGDREIDTSTGLRNHPLEAVAAAGCAAVVVTLLGAPVGAVVAVDALLFAAALWQHAAIPVPPRVAGLAEWLLVTPRTHLIHHSPQRSEHDRNYGDLLTLWDRAFGTHTPPLPAPTAIGLDDEATRISSLPAQLLAPFRS